MSLLLISVKKVKIMYRLASTLYTLPMSLWDFIYGGFNTRHYTLVRGFCLFKLFPIGCMELKS